MNFSQLFRILKARYKIVLITLAVIVLSTLVINLLTPKTYTATSALVLNYKGLDPVTGLSLPAQMMPGYMPTQVDIITSHNVAALVVDNLKFSQSLSVQEQFQKATGGKGALRDWLADRLLDGLEAKPSRESSVIEISFRGSDPEFAAVVANAFAEAYQQISVQLKVDPSKTASDYLNTQVKVLRDNLEQAQSRLSKYQQEKGLTSPVEQFDVENSRLNELSSQLSIAQAQAIEATSRMNGTRGDAAASPDIASSPLVQGLKGDIARAESKLADLSQRLDKNHPQYQSAQAELDKLKSELQNEIRNTKSSVGGNASIFNQRESALRTQVAAQKKRVLELNLARDQFSVLQRDVESAQRALEAVNQRFTQTRLESQTSQTDIAILNPAIAPIRPTGPRVKLNTALSFFLGSILAIGLGLIAEMGDRRVRGREDIVDSLGVAVLAVIDGKPERNAKFKFPTISLARKLARPV